MAEPIKVVHVVLSLDVGGLERVVIDLVREGIRREMRPSILCLERPGSLASRAEELGVEVITIGKKPGLRPGIITKIRSVLRKLKPDVLHTHQIGALLYAGPAARRERVPAIVHTEHGNHAALSLSSGRSLRIRLLLALASRHAARFFCVSRDIGDAVAAWGVVPRRKVVVMPNGIDTAESPGTDVEAVRRELDIPDGVPIVGTVGRLVEVKRQDNLIEAFARILDRHPGAHLILVGDGPEAQPLRALAERLGLGGRVHFTGYQPQPRRFLAAMDVFALTSRMEGMPLAILEAWATGVPVVATAVGGIAGLVRHSEDTLAVKFGDEQGLSNALSELLDDPALARRIGEAGRLRAIREFDSGVMTEAYGREYRRVLGHGMGVGG